MRLPNNKHKTTFVHSTYYATTQQRIHSKPLGIEVHCICYNPIALEEYNTESKVTED